MCQDLYDLKFIRQPHEEFIQFIRSSIFMNILITQRLGIYQNINLWSFAFLKEEALSCKPFVKIGHQSPFFLQKQKFIRFPQKVLNFYHSLLQIIFPRYQKDLHYFHGKNKSSNHNGRGQKILQTYYYSRKWL